MKLFRLTFGIGINRESCVGSGQRRVGFPRFMLLIASLFLSFSSFEVAGRWRRSTEGLDKDIERLQAMADRRVREPGSQNTDRCGKLERFSKSVPSQSPKSFALSELGDPNRRSLNGETESLYWECSMEGAFAAVVPPEDYRKKNPNTDEYWTRPRIVYLSPKTLRLFFIDGRLYSVTYDPESTPASPDMTIRIVK